MIIFGVQDKPPREIVGSQYRDAAGLVSLKHEIAQQTNGLTFQEIYELQTSKGRVLIFQIPAAPAGMPSSWQGHYYGRDGESLGALSILELESIRHQVGHPDWSAEICSEATIADLDEEALAVARKNSSKNTLKIESVRMLLYGMI